MSATHDPLDDLLRETLEGAETAPAPDTWKQVRHSLDGKPRPPYWYLLLALILLAGSLALYRITAPDDANPAPLPQTVTKQDPVAPTLPPKGEDVLPPPVSVKTPDPVAPKPQTAPVPQPRENPPVRTEPVSLTIPVFLPEGSTEEEPIKPEVQEPNIKPQEPAPVQDPAPVPAPKGGEPQSGKKPPGLLGIIAKGADVVMGDMVDYTEKEHTNGYELKVSLFGKKINISKN